MDDLTRDLLLLLDRPEPTLLDALPLQLQNAALLTRASRAGLIDKGGRGGSTSNGATTVDEHLSYSRIIDFDWWDRLLDKHRLDVYLRLTSDGRLAADEARQSAVAPVGNANAKGKLAAGEKQKITATPTPAAIARAKKLVNAKDSLGLNYPMIASKFRCASPAAAKTAVSRARGILRKTESVTRVT